MKSLIRLLVVILYVTLCSNVLTADASDSQIESNSASHAAIEPDPAATPISLPRPIDPRGPAGLPIPIPRPEGLPIPIPRPAGSHGQINDVRILQENARGYQVEVSFSGVKFPQDVSLIAEAYSPQGRLLEYVAPPMRISQSQGLEQLGLFWQESPGGRGYGGNPWAPGKQKVSHIVVKLVRDDDPENVVAQYKHRILKTPPGQPPSSIADNQTFCNSYADLAVSQFHQARQLGCQGVVPPVWSADRNGHLNWCLAVPKNFADGETSKRTDFIDQCSTHARAGAGGSTSTGFCQQYAQKAIQDYRTAKEAGCAGIIPPVWTPNYNHHYDWCLKVPQGTAAQGTAMREGHLQQCMN